MGSGVYYFSTDQELINWWYLASRCSCGFNFPRSVCVHFPNVRKFCCAGLFGEIGRSKIDDLV